MSSALRTRVHLFLSSNAQDFIEDLPAVGYWMVSRPFLSSNAQDFIEDGPVRGRYSDTSDS